MSSGQKDHKQTPLLEKGTQNSQNEQNLAKEESINKLNPNDSPRDEIKLTPNRNDIQQSNEQSKGDENSSNNAKSPKKSKDSNDDDDEDDDAEDQAMNKKNKNQNKKVEPTVPQSPGSPTTEPEVENYDQENDMVYDSFSAHLEQIEQAQPDTAGIKFVTYAILLFAIIISVTRAYMPLYTNIEIYFVGYLVSFLINYAFVRSQNIRPFIENQEDNFMLQVAAFCLLGTIVLMLYSFQFITKSIAICVWFIVAVSVTGISELRIFQERYSTQEVSYALLALFGALVTSSSDIFTLFSFNSTEYQQSYENYNNSTLRFMAADTLPTTNFNSTMDSTESMVPLALRSQYYYGLIAAFVAACLTAYFGVIMRKLNQTHVLSNYHVVSLIIVLFLPAFFPIEGLKSPGLKEWGAMLLFGVIFEVIMLYVVRALQIEKPAQLLFYAPLFSAFTSILDILIFRCSDGKTQLLGALIIIVSLYYLTNETTKQIRSSNFYETKDMQDKNRPQRPVEMSDFVGNQQKQNQDQSKNSGEDEEYF